ncbi:MAG: Zn-dependent hydrolase [Gemmatimonadetes bacterium]|nr:Zn-dependent hydrolase [Gemmatimonadota bacterium]
MRRRSFTRTMLGALGAASLPGSAARSLGGARGTDPLREIGPAGASSPRAATGAELDDALRVDGARINGHLAQLAEFGKNPQGGVSRMAYSEADRRGREWLMGVYRDAGLAPRIDTAGNIVARIDGTDPSLKPLVIGSHIDSVPEGGNFDGDVGTLSSVEVGRTLLANQRRLRHPLDIVCWQNEEGGLVGSRIVSGEFPMAELEQKGTAGKTLREGIAFIGGDVNRFAESRRAKGDIAAYVELHIEQGGTLEARKLDIGVVEGIVGLYHWDVEVTGFANHAGTTAMRGRRDALLAASRFIEMVNHVVTSEPGRQVGTVGHIEAYPGAPNVIPGRVRLTLELRDLAVANVERLYARIVKEATVIGQRSGTRFAFTPTVSHLPALSDPRIREFIRRSAQSLGLSTLTLPSGAGHDAQSMARLGPMGMIFIPSVGGISHAPTEFSKAADITNGANVLLRTVLALDGWGA